MENIATYINRRINSILDNGILKNVVIDCIIVTEQVDKTLNKEGLILERKDYFSPVPGLKHYGYRIDKQLGDGGPGRQRHIHGYYDGKEFYQFKGMKPGTLSTTIKGDELIKAKSKL